MSDLDALAESLDQQDGVSRKSKKMPPVHLWDPPFTGDMDLVIKANGDWYHEGTLIHRQALVSLLASVLKKEGDEYFLVSPVEKWRIQVEDAPLLVNEVLFAESDIIFKTATGDEFTLDKEHPLYVCNPETETRPYVLVRDELQALIHRNVFYQLVEHATEREGVLGLESAGDFFALGPLQEATS